MVHFGIHSICSALSAALKFTCSLPLYIGDIVFGTASSGCVCVSQCSAFSTNASWCRVNSWSCGGASYGLISGYWEYCVSQTAENLGTRNYIQDVHERNVLLKNQEHKRAIDVGLLLPAILIELLILSRLYYRMFRNGEGKNQIRVFHEYMGGGLTGGTEAPLGIDGPVQTEGSLSKVVVWIRLGYCISFVFFCALIAVEPEAGVTQPLFDKGVDLSVCLLILGLYWSYWKSDEEARALRISEEGAQREEPRGLVFLAFVLLCAAAGLLFHWLIVANLGRLQFQALTLMLLVMQQESAPKEELTPLLAGFRYA